ncbi:hypothetical protein PQR34_45340 [Paraburkholderia sediminicola]|uniref:hypothetical protein n=1 Tax=Paraburkholderia sediminicola TaxID=458836 RepID=UPI0038B796C7
MTNEENEKTAVDRMWKATGAFMQSLDAQPGWKEFQKAKMRRAIDSAMDPDEMFLRDDALPDEFLFPTNVAQQHDVVIQYLGLLESVSAVKSCEYYFRRYPFRGLPVSRHEHLTNVCEMFFGRFYEFRERIKKYSEAIAAVVPDHRLEFGKFIKQFDKEFDRELRERNQIHHHRRFSDLAIDQIFLTGVISQRRADKGWEAEHLAAYRKAANEWARRAKTRGARMDEFMEAIAEATLHVCSFLSVDAKP